MVVSSGDINSALRLVCNGFLCGGGVLNRGFNEVVTAIDELRVDCGGGDCGWDAIRSSSNISFWVDGFSLFFSHSNA
jgi:hypothetical protein